MLKSFVAIFCLGLMIPLYSMKKIAKFNKASLNKITKLNKRDYWVSLGFSGTLNKEVDIPDKVIERYKKDYQVDSDKDISSTIREFYRYACLAKWQDRTSDEVKTLPMFSKKVDNFWHTFLLFNNDYEQFCKKLPQKKMIARAWNFIWHGELFSMLYHNPYPDEQRCPEACQYYAKGDFEYTYERMYGSLPPQDIWTGLKKCENCPVEKMLQEKEQRDQEEKQRIQEESQKRELEWQKRQFEWAEQRIQCEEQRLQKVEQKLQEEQERLRFKRSRITELKKDSSDKVSSDIVTSVVIGTYFSDSSFSSSCSSDSSGSSDSSSSDSGSSCSSCGD